MRRLLPLAAMPLTVLALSCETEPGKSVPFLVSSEQEVRIGQEVDVQIEAEYKIAKADDPTTVWAQQLVAKLADSSKKFRDPAEFGGYKVEVIADDTLVNAFAAPGGYTYVATGLLLKAKTCAEIAGVLGHEIGHVTARHGVRALEKQFLASEFLKILTDDATAQKIGQAAWTALQETKFSQDQENESDTVGLQVAQESGFNPYGLVDFFAKLLASEDPNNPFQFLSSHPATQDRINAITAQIEKKYGTSANPGEGNYACLGTTLQLADIQAHIQGGKVQVRPETGTKPQP